MKNESVDGIYKSPVPEKAIYNVNTIYFITMVQDQEVFWCKTIKNRTPR